MFYILSRYYAPNSAPTNHALSFIRGFSELGIQAEWVFIMPNGDFAKCEHTFPHIHIRYQWKERIARFFILKHLFKHIAYAKFYFSLKKGDVVLLLGGYSFLHGLVRRKGIRVFHERTEHPDAYPISKYKFFSIHYIDDCKKVEGLFVISNALKTYFEKVGVPSDKVHVINMVVDSHRFKHVVKNDDVEPYIAYCGKASNNKDGVDCLIKAFAIVAAKKKDIKLYIIGEAPPKESDNRELVHSLGLEDRVIFTGVISSDNIPKLLTNAKILALARPKSLQNTYGFPTKLGEYLLTGNPVVVTRVGDIPLFLKDKISALLSECGDIKGFADNIIWALDHPKESKEIGNIGKIIADEEFNYLVETQKMCNFLFHQKE